MRFSAGFLQERDDGGLTGSDVRCSTGSEPYLLDRRIRGQPPLGRHNGGAGRSFVYEDPVNYFDESPKKSRFSLQSPEDVWEAGEPDPFALQHIDRGLSANLAHGPCLHPPPPQTSLGAP